MVKIKNPLFSLGAVGRLTRAITFTRRRKVDIAEKTPGMVDVKSYRQLTWRTMFLMARDLWIALNAAEKRAWESAGTARHMTGYALFISQALKPNPLIFLPLAGGTMTGPIDMGGNKIENLPDPSANQEADTQAARNTAIAADIATHAADPNAHHTDYSSLEFIIDGSGSPITLGEKGHLEVPFAGEIVQVTLLADQDGAIKVDIWKDTYANFPPIDADSICGGNEPEIVATGRKAQDATLTAWTTALILGDVLAFNVDSCTTITRVTVSLLVRKS